MNKNYRGKSKAAYDRGYGHGLEHAQYCEMTQAEFNAASDNDSLGEILGEIVESFRQYSPFEFLASEFNKARNSERLWDAYDTGEYDGWMKGLENRFAVIQPGTGGALVKRGSVL